MDILYSYSFENIWSPKLHLFLELFAALPLLFTAMSIFRQKLSYTRDNHNFAIEEQRDQISSEASPEAGLREIGTTNPQQHQQEQPIRKISLNAINNNNNSRRKNSPIKSGKSNKKKSKSRCASPPSEVPDLAQPPSWTEESRQAVKSAAEGISQLACTTISKGASFLLPAQRIRRTATGTLKHPDELPPDVQLNILSFLHPKDIVSFSGTSKACQEIVDGEGPTTVALWKTLWERDYGWIIHSWEVGRQAYLRSRKDMATDQVHGKEFYFRFGLSYINYVLAGQNKQEKCLVGLHGNVYDMTDFVLKHPGSPDTLLVHAGRDSTVFFDDMDHSRYARKVAKEYCIVVDLTYQYNGSHGIKPTAAFQADRPTPAVRVADPVITKRIRKPRRRNTLARVFGEFHHEQWQFKQDFIQEMKSNSNVLHSNMFYDPFREEWTGWYTSKDFETVFSSWTAKPYFATGRNDAGTGYDDYESLDYYNAL